MTFERFLAGFKDRAFIVLAALATLVVLVAFVFFMAVMLIISAVAGIISPDVGRQIRDAIDKRSDKPAEPLETRVPTAPMETAARMQ